MAQQDKCFACGRKLGKNPHIAVTSDGQHVFVGSECHKYIKVSGAEGYQPPRIGNFAIGPKLYPVGLGTDHVFGGACDGSSDRVCSCGVRLYGGKF